MSSLLVCFVSSWSCHVSYLIDFENVFLSEILENQLLVRNLLCGLNQLDCAVNYMAQGQVGDMNILSRFFWFCSCQDTPYHFFRHCKSSLVGRWYTFWSK